jgi:hypothetical protein
MAGGQEREIPRNITPQQGSRPDQQPIPREPDEGAPDPTRQPEPRQRPYRPRRKPSRFVKGRDLAPYTPEEEEEMRRGVSEWEIQSRRTRDQSRSSLAPLSPEQQSKREKKLKRSRRYHLNHRAERLEYARRSYHSQKRKSFRQVRAEVEAQRQGERQALGQPSEADIPQRDRERPDARQIFPSPPTTKPSRPL